MDATVKRYYAIAGMTVAMSTHDTATPDTVTLSYLLTDHLGSVVVVTDDDGEHPESQRYLPFGGVRGDEDQIDATDFGYTFQRNLDAQGTSYSLGLMDYKARFYDPQLGRFIQPDTVVSGGPQILY
jgi:RHS repeat-associated protein